MSLIAGIDLGTTNSCIAVPADADIPARDRLIADGRLRPMGDALVVTTPERAPTIPSVVWIGPDGEPLVGLRAKHKARADQHPPARFFKRAMGTNHKVRAGHAELSPVEASAHVLRHLKQMAEEVLGVPVSRAVITVPAFFETTAKTDTTQAGTAAGLEVVETLIEPVAAAMAYTRGEALDAPTSFCVYDLGGGTFDTSIVRWEPGSGFDCLAFDGDRYLGGYDFDRRIVGWIAEQLPAYRLDIDTENPAHQRVLAQLTAVAESAKHDLSRFGETDVVDEHGFDLDGEPMTVNVPFSRDAFNALIEASLLDTIAHCDRALDKARIDAGQLDEIIMVGGSSRVPLVGELLAERFGREPKLLNPDLCVAVGAALKAGSAASRSRNLELDQPEPGDGVADIGGRILPGGEVTSPSGLTVTLASDDGMIDLTETTDSAGRFLFPDVPVDDDEETAFSVRIHASGRIADTQRLVVDTRQTRRPGETGAVGDVLAHDFHVELVDGPYKVVASETRVPYRTDFTLKTASRGSVLTVRIIEGPVPIGDVTIEGLSPDMPEGTPVEVTLEFQPDWTIHARARVPSAGAQATALIHLPRRDVPSWDELARQIRELHAGWSEKRETALPEDVLRAGPRLDRLAGELDALLAERQDSVKTHHKLLEAQTLIRGIRLADDRSAGLMPPMREFTDRLAALDDLIAAVARHDPGAAEGLRTRAENLARTGHAAHEAGDPLDWRRANQLLADQITEARRALPDRDEPPAVSPDQLRQYLTEEVGRLRAEVAHHAAGTTGAARAEGERYLGELDALQRDIDRQDLTDTETATRRLAGIYQNRLRPLTARVNGWQTRADEIAIRKAD